MSDTATSCPQNAAGHEYGRPMWHTYAREFGRMCKHCGQLKDHPWFQSDPPTITTPQRGREETE